MQIFLKPQAKVLYYPMDMFQIRNFRVSPNRIPINLIAAVDSKWGLSRKNQIPWEIREDMNFFHDVTKRELEKGKKNAVIMGRNTFEALPDDNRGLKERVNVVVSSSVSNLELMRKNVSQEECYLVNNFNQAVRLCN